MTTTSYISSGCNRTPHSLDCGKNGLICYAARNAIAIYDPKLYETGKVIETLHNHKESVIVVRWIKGINDEEETEILSGSIDGTITVWKKFENTYKPVKTLQDSSPVKIATALYIPNDDKASLLICTGNINGEIKIWLRHNNVDNGDIKLSQIIEFDKKLPIEAALWVLPGSNNTPIIAIALEDSSIELLSCNNNNDDENYGNEKVFIKVQKLIGHEDWVRCLDFTNDNNGDVLLASGSQDSMIRLWRISLANDKEKKKNDDNYYNKDENLEQKKEIFMINDKEYNVGLESILISHEGWVYGLNWQNHHRHSRIKNSDNEIPSKELKLLSCSLDKTMILWEADRESGIWLESVRVGDVGGNSLGFYGCKFGPYGNSLISHGYQGSIHMWDYSSKEMKWAARSAPSGHFNEVIDLCWDPKGRFLLTTSLDQTTRAHAPWKFNSNDENWHEIGRPQVHGYDMSCMAMITPYIFASGAEEKVVRTFSAPTTFVNYLKKLSNADDCGQETAESASVPALGLTNKAVFHGDEIPTGEDNLYVGNSRDLDFGKPPTEEELIQHTLWPELQKLYGHGYEIFSMAAKFDGSMLATACKSSSIEHSAVILWDTKTWRILNRLISHQLTVTQLSFSPNDKYLLSVSRDRRWSLFEYIDEKIGYRLKAASNKKDGLHSRIIWSCAWSHDSIYFATGSRDGKIGIWKPEEFSDKEYRPFTSMEIKDASITALAFAGSNAAGRADSYVLAIGFDSGNIEIHKLIVDKNSTIFRKFETLDSSRAHHLTVKRLSFRPETGNFDKEILQLASCGSDNFVKIHNINLEELSLL